jgi:anti-repressor protein
MTYKVKQFNFKGRFKGQTIHVVTFDGEPYFVAREITKVLGYQWPANALRDYVDNDDKATIDLHLVKRGNPARVIINKSGLNSLIVNSTSPRAAEFRQWTAEKLTPSIRKHNTKLEEALKKLNTVTSLEMDLKNERERRLIAEQIINELTPNPTYYDQILAHKEPVIMEQIAEDYGMSYEAMNHKLSELGVIYKEGDTWLLRDKYQHEGWTLSKVVLKDKTGGTQKVVTNTKWTQKGRLGLYELLKKHNILPLVEL